MEAATTATATETPADPAEAGSEPATGSDATAPTTGADATSDERDEGGKFLSREAAGYRRRLRDTEQERDQLRAQLDRLQTAEVERLASAAGLQVPGDVWTFGADLPSLRTETGDIDTETVNGLVGEITKDRPGLASRPVGDLGIGRGAAAAGTTHAPEVGLSQLLKPGRA